MTNMHDQKISSMFGHITKWYDPMNRILSGGLDIYWRKCLVETIIPKTTNTVLDIAAGTLDVSIALNKLHPDLNILAMDICFDMLSYGKQKIKQLETTKIFPITANAKKLPLQNACVDGITIAFGIRNTVPRLETLAELARVLIPGGKLSILEFGTGKKRVWFGFYNFYLTKILPLIGKITKNSSAYTYLAESIMEFPTPCEFINELYISGFYPVYYQPITSGIVHLYVAEKMK